jgi:cbb3-type cytochrome oxidase maturation protein
MKDYFYLIPIALGIGLTALAAFMWSLKNGQYEDLEGAAERILHEDAPIRGTPRGSDPKPSDPALPGRIVRRHLPGRTM